MRALLPPLTLLLCACPSSSEPPSIDAGLDLALPASCGNQTQDGDETDVDCGGSCAPCAAERTCMRGADCTSGFCTNKRCDPPSCSDGVKNGEESDVDCGGGCPGCALGQMCKSGADCLSASCPSGTCAASMCMNGVKDVSETDVDCGGICPKCDVGQMCKGGQDCKSGQCTNNTCKAAGSCSDGIRNNSETDVDCGGPECGKCGDGKECGLNDDCQSGTCSMNLCAPMPCNTGLADCDKDPQNGCEVKLAGDPKNCGACGKVCAGGQNGAAACQGGGCVLQCHTGFGNCDGNAGNGCETDLTKDAGHCGACGAPCAGGTICAGGKCQSPPATYSALFTQGALTGGQCSDWKLFLTTLSGTYSKITIKGSNDATGVSCTGGGANQLCQALRTAAAISIVCDGRTWSTGPCGGGSELSTLGVACNCGVSYAVRPCVGNANWGGVNTSICAAPTQTMTVICE